MKLTPPKQNTFWIATILAALGIIGKLITIPFVSANAFWFVAAGFILLWLANTIKGL